MQKSRPKHTQEFKHDPVSQLLTGSSGSKSASAQAISPKTLATWVKLNQQNPSTPANDANLSPDKAEIARLRRELAAVKLEMSRLMDATAQFVRFSI
ncbi:MAG: transposase [Rhodoferax sp.]|uniref:transposase n=1 Tax=Rhodoferax sp. TaxID=50421 RepID=UPI00301A7B18